MTRRLLLVLSSFGLMCTASAPVLAQQQHAVRISTASVRIVPTALDSGETATDITDTHWTLRGYDLKSILAHIEGTDPARIDLESPALEGRRYDITLPLAGSESDAAIAHTLRAAIEQHFGIHISSERRMVPVTVITAPNGAASGLRPHTSVAFAPEEFSYDEQICPNIRKVGVTAKAASIRSFSRTLSREFGEVYVDETGLRGAYDFNVSQRASKAAFFAALHEQLGLVFTRSERPVDILVVRPAGQSPRPQPATLEVASVN